jgi:hypothetical protein
MTMPGDVSPEGHQPTDEEMLAAYEAQIKQLRVEDVLVQTLISLVNLGGRKAGLAPGAEDERDLPQLKMAVDGARALLPIVEPALGPEASQVRQAITQLQMAYAQAAGPGAPGGPEAGAAPGAGGPGSPAGPAGPGAQPGGAGDAQRTGRLWVPGQ